MPHLSWISDQTLENAVEKLLDSAGKALSETEQRQNINVIDPFLSLLTASIFDALNREQLIRWQNASSALRGSSSALGMFHQEVLAGAGKWINHDAGYDLECLSEQALAEVKNKHNTMNGPNRQKVLEDLDTAVKQKGSGWTGYLVIIIPKHPKRYTEKLNTPRPVFETDGASFYEMVTGDPNALHDLFDFLCRQLCATEEIFEYCQKLMSQSIPPRK